MKTEILALLALAQAPHPATSQSQPVLLPLLEKGPGAPTKENLDKTIVLTEFKKNDPWYASIEALNKGGYKEVLIIHPWDPKKAFKKLAKEKPGAVIGVFHPTTLSVNFHFDFLERATKLDKDPFTDFTFGYITGGTPEEAAAFASNACKLQKKQLKKSILEFGPSTNPAPISGKTPHKWAKGFTTQRWAHENDDPTVAQTLAKLAPEGILSAWGHGMPDGVDHGMTGQHLSQVADLDLSKSIYFSGPCYCGVPSVWFDNQGGQIAKVEVAPEDSFLLGLLRARSGAVFAGLDPDRGETNHHEREHVLSGQSLGQASKATYDDVIMARRTQELKLPRYVPGSPRPHKNVTETMIAGGACRALFGLPLWEPFKSAGELPFEVKAKKVKKGIEIDWTGGDDLGKYWLPVDVFHGEGGWTHRLRFRCEVPLKTARKLGEVELIELTKDGQELEHYPPTAALELFGEKAYLHVTIAFPRNEKDRALWNGKEFRAHLRLTR